MNEEKQTKKTPLPIGKLDSKLLEEIVFQNISYKRPEVKQSPGIGEDCAIVNYGDYDCVLSTDPITGAVNQIGKLAINITCNDIASNGVEPLGIMLAVMLPVGTTEEEIKEIMQQASKEAERLKVEIIGGHTEITNAVNKPVIVSTAIGKCVSGKAVNSDNIKVGDFIMMTKEAGLEGIGIIAFDKTTHIEKYLSVEELKKAKDMLLYTDVVTEGVIAGEIGVSGMHDVTEGGILGAVWEMCKTSGLGAEIMAEAVPVSALTQKICKVMDLNVLRLISSGCMMIIVDPQKKDLLEKQITAAGVKITSIGKVMQKDCVLIKNGKRETITPPESDELYKALAWKENN